MAIKVEIRGLANEAARQEIEGMAVFMLRKFPQLDEGTISLSHDENVSRWMAVMVPGNDTPVQKKEEAFAATGESPRAAMMALIEFVTVKYSNAAAITPSVTLLLDPGTATSEELADLFGAMSAAYRAMGGTGLAIEITDVRELKMAEACS